MAAPVKLDLSIKRGHKSGGFGIEILWPGVVNNLGDSGIGAIGRIDHAKVSPGTVVPMHPHKDDEILTYLRSGKVRHIDTVGHTEEISNKRMMLMGAGHSFQHEEHVLDKGGVLEGLQIFMRPRTSDLEPIVQFHDFDTAFSENEWRLIAGATDAPLTIRADAWLHDVRLQSDRILDLPKSPNNEVVRLLYVFTGRIQIAGITLSEGESALIDSDNLSLEAEEQSDLVLFTTDPTTPIYRGGMFSGNIMS